MIKSIFWNFNFWLEINDKCSLVLPSFSRPRRKWNILICALKKMVAMGQEAYRSGGRGRRKDQQSSLLWIERNFQNLQTPTLFIPKTFWLGGIAHVSFSLQYVQWKTLISFSCNFASIQLPILSWPLKITSRIYPAV